LAIKGGSVTGAGWLRRDKQVGFAEINKLGILWVFIFPILIMTFQKKYTKIIDFLYKKALYYYCGISL